MEYITGVFERQHVKRRCGWCVNYHFRFFVAVIWSSQNYDKFEFASFRCVFVRSTCCA